MFLTLQVVEGPGLGTKIFLRPGQRTTIGRTEEADCSIPDNAGMSHVHFELDCHPEGCAVRDLNSTNGTLLNGALIEMAELKDGDQLKAGDDLFCVSLTDEGEACQIHTVSEQTISGPVAGPVAAESSPEAVADASSAAEVDVLDDESTGSESPELDRSGFRTTTAHEICGGIEQLEDAAKALLHEEHSPQQYIERLEQHELFTDAMYFIAHALAKRSAVEWACGCVRDISGNELSEGDTNALKGADAWVADPSEEHRREALAAAESQEFGTPASWAAMGAVWSHGSLAPPDSPIVPPAPHLYATAAASAVQLAAVVKEPQDAADKYRHFVQRGLEIGNR